MVTRFAFILAVIFFMRTTSHHKYSLNIHNIGGAVEITINFIDERVTYLVCTFDGYRIRVRLV
ncbi:hypothetical protein A5715_05430 [Mycolicibacter heraklionensis]|nr:hypothetical protein A5715_05430 [Mycolicibacter heraklionensis]